MVNIAILATGYHLYQKGYPFFRGFGRFWVEILLESGLIPDRWFEAPMEDEAVSAINMLQDMNLGIS